MYGDEHMTESIADLLLTRRVIVTAGAGGVGKTTTAAAMSVAAARAGRRVLCLTIDPARRLAESLGIEEMTTEAAVVDPARFEAAGVPITGSLTAMMLDTKRTFDELIAKYASTPEKRDKLLSNKLYKYVSTQLAGTQEYMAMEKLVAVRADDRYDLIVLDTPPTPNALDFLDAPERMVEALDSATMRWFVEAFQSSGKFSLNFVAKGAGAVLKGIGKITGGDFLPMMAEFLADLNDLFGGFKERAQMVHDALRNPEVAFIVVTSPSPPSIQEALFFSERLVEHSMPRGGFIVNRFHVAPSAPAVDSAELEGLASNLDLGETGRARLAQAHADAVRIAAFDAEHVKALEASVNQSAPIVKVVAFATDVHDIAKLAMVGEAIVAGGVA